MRPENLLIMEFGFLILKKKKDNWPLFNPYFKK